MPITFEDTDGSMCDALNSKPPHELHNEYAQAPVEIKQQLEEQLDALRQCSAEECRAAEDG